MCIKLFNYWDKRFLGRRVHSLVAVIATSWWQKINLLLLIILTLLLLLILMQNQRDALILKIYFWSRTLHISDRCSVHHQESSTVHTAIAICHTGCADCLLACCCCYCWYSCSCSLLLTKSTTPGRFCCWCCFVAGSLSISQRTFASWCYSVAYICMSSKCYGMLVQSNLSSVHSKSQHMYLLFLISFFADATARIAPIHFSTITPLPHLKSCRL